jgi:hypothetical protein
MPSTIQIDTLCDWLNVNITAYKQPQWNYTFFSYAMVNQLRRKILISVEENRRNPPQKVKSESRSGT